MAKHRIKINMNEIIDLKTAQFESADKGLTHPLEDLANLLERSKANNYQGFAFNMTRSETGEVKVTINIPSESERAKMDAASGTNVPVKEEAVEIKPEMPEKTPELPVEPLVEEPKVAMRKKYPDAFLKTMGF